MVEADEQAIESKRRPFDLEAKLLADRGAEIDIEAGELIAFEIVEWRRRPFGRDPDHARSLHFGEIAGLGRQRDGQEQAESQTKD